MCLKLYIANIPVSHDDTISFYGCFAMHSLVMNLCLHDFLVSYIVYNIATYIHNSYSSDYVALGF